jgi:hypothetical protein
MDLNNRCNLVGNTATKSARIDQPLLLANSAYARDAVKNNAWFVSDLASEGCLGDDGQNNVYRDRDLNSSLATDGAAGNCGNQVDRKESSLERQSVGPGPKLPPKNGWCKNLVSCPI